MKFKGLSLIPVVVSCVAASLFAVGHQPQVADREPARMPVVNTSSNSEVRKLMRKVEARYSGISSFKCRGKSEHRTESDGTEKIEKPILFEIDYARSRPSTISWDQDGKHRVLTVSEGTARLEVDGQRSDDFTSARDGLMSVTFGSRGRSIFGISSYVFRDELQLKQRFFSWMQEPITVESRTEAGRTYALLTGSYRNVDAKETYWIDRETNLITKIERTMTMRTTTDGKESVSVHRTVESYWDIEAK